MTAENITLEFRCQPIVIALFTCLVICSCNVPTQAGQTGTVLSHQKISDTEGNFTGSLVNGDYFGSAAASIGDLDGDSVSDIAVGASANLGEGASGTGSIWILFLDPNGDVNDYQKISDTEGNFTGTLDVGDGFGCSITSIGDLDGDGIADIIVGADWDDDGGSNKGAVWVLFLDPNGMVKSHQKISETQGNFTGTLGNYDHFGSSVTSIDDLDGDGVTDIAVGAYLDGDGGAWRGAVWILFLDPNGTVKTHQKISDTEGNFTGTLHNWDVFGYSVTSLGDLDGDGTTDIAVGSAWDDDGGNDNGAVWVLFLDPNGMVKSHQKISETQGNFAVNLGDQYEFGTSVTSIGDLNGDGFNDLAVGAVGDNGGNNYRGGLWLLFLDADGTVKNYLHINELEGNFTGTLHSMYFFGASIMSLGDLDGDEVTDIAVGGPGDDDGGESRGAVWVLFLYDCLYELKGDVDNDCNVDFLDFAVLADNWLIDCDLTPGDPACIPK